jgi:hypothetical protein
MSKKPQNKELDKMLSKIKEAKKNGDNKIVVFKTNRNTHKKKLKSEMGFGVEDLKPKFYEAYKHLICKFNLKTKLISLTNLEVEWIINMKK